MKASSNEPSKELVELIEAVVDGAATLEQKRMLAEEMREAPCVEKLYVEHCCMHAALAWEHGVLGDHMYPSDQDLIGRRRMSLASYWLRKARPLAIAAVLALAATYSWRFAAIQVRERAWSVGQQVGTLERNAGGVLQVSNTKIRISTGEALRTGDYELREGLAGLKLANNVYVVIEAPSRFRIDSADLVHLYDGKLSANVPPESIGFKVVTPSAEIIDLGTQFGVDVTKDKNSEVHVFEGEVEVKPSAASEPPLFLYSDQATRVDSHSGLPSGIAMDPNLFHRSFDEPTILYSRQIRAFNPTVYHRMSITDDGNTLLDRSGNGHDARILKGHSQESPFAPGYIGAALQLEDGQTYATIEECPASQSNQLSVVAWVYAKSRPRAASIAKTKHNKDYGQFQLGLLHDQGGLEARVKDSDGNLVQVMDTEPLPLSKWHHIALVADGEFVQLYKNGSLVSRAPIKGLVSIPSQLLSIGININTRDALTPNSPSHFWNGRIDELALFDRALSHEQIKLLYETLH